MITVEIIVPYLEFSAVAERAFSDYPRKGEVNLILSEISHSQIRNHRFTGDIIIARGLSAFLLNNFIVGTNIILELPMTGYDILRAIYRGINRHDYGGVAIIAAENVIYGIKNSDIPFPVHVSTYSITGVSDIDEVVLEAVRNGASLIVGGDSVVPVCEKYGIDFERIDVGVETVRQVLDEAIRIFNLNREERARSERFKAVIENVDEGIISCDRDKRIVFNNKFVRNIFVSVGTPLEGMLLSELCPALDDPKLEDLSAPETGKIMLLANTDYVVSRIPVFVEGRFTSGIIVFQKLANIHKIESEFRSNTKRKSFVAKYDFNNILGSSPIISNAKSTANDYSKVDANVLIIGETGTGKELFAQSIHNASSRANNPFVAVNCAALPSSLLESELFGYAGGAFTGASKEGKMGLFEMAHTGTIFLDEISEMNMDLQGRLLRVIEQREIMRIGHDRVIPIDIRIIAATNKDIQKLVDNNEFRRDLFYRLNVLRLRIPSLKEMKSDIPMLMQHYLEYYDKKHKTVPHMLDSSIFDLLQHQSWPGNTRQLRNLCERLSTVVKRSIIGVEDILSYCDDNEKTMTHIDSELMELRSALESVGYNRGKAAEILKIDRSTLYRRMKKYKLL